MNVLGYLFVLRKYKKNPDVRVENYVNDMIILYLCKIAGCFLFAFFISYIWRNLAADGYDFRDFRSKVMLCFIILFYFTPSVKKGVKTIQDKYMYRTLKEKKSASTRIG